MGLNKLLFEKTRSETYEDEIKKEEDYYVSFVAYCDNRVYN